MDIHRVPVGADQVLVTGEGRQHPEFDLGVVRVHKDISLRRHEHAADPASHLRADRNVLEIRLRG